MEGKSGAASEANHWLPKGSTPSDAFHVERPTKLTNVDWNHEPAAQLHTLAAQQDFPHLLLVGPNGAGKRTLVHLLLFELFGLKKLKPIKHTVDTPGGTGKKKRFSAIVYENDAWVEIHPALYRFDDRHVVRHVLSNYVTTQPFRHSTKKEGASPFKVVVIHGLDTFTPDAQKALRATFQLLSPACCLVSTAESFSSILPALRSRCLPIFVPRPTSDQLRSILHHNGCSRADEIISHAGRDTHRAFFTAEFVRSPEDTCILSWERTLFTLIQCLFEPFRDDVLALRTACHRLLQTGVPTVMLLRSLTHQLMRCDIDEYTKCHFAIVAADHVNAFRLCIQSYPTLILTVQDLIIADGLHIEAAFFAYILTLYTLIHGMDAI